MFLIKEEAWTSSGITFTRSFFDQGFVLATRLSVPNWVQVLIYDFTFVQGLPIQLKLHIGITRAFEKESRTGLKNTESLGSPLSEDSSHTQTQSVSPSYTRTNISLRRDWGLRVERKRDNLGKMLILLCLCDWIQMGSLNFLCVVSLWECRPLLPTKSSRRKIHRHQPPISGILERSPFSQGWPWVERERNCFQTFGQMADSREPCTLEHNHNK